jgi:S1-C subfamily serine protease
MFDLDRAFRSIVTIQSSVPEDAYTAQTLGEQRTGSGVVIRESGLILTIGYLVTEAETVWVARHDGHVVPASVFCKHSTGSIVQPSRLDAPAKPS